MKIWKIILLILGLGCFFYGEMLIGNQTYEKGSIVTLSMFIVDMCWGFMGLVLMTPWVLNKNKGDENGNID